jgi:hypothetical protein
MVLDLSPLLRLQVSPRDVKKVWDSLVNQYPLQEGISRGQTVVVQGEGPVAACSILSTKGEGLDSWHSWHC